MTVPDKHPSARRAFTMTELLIVIVLIVVILGIAIPTLSVLTGSRSAESAKNQIAAMLGRTRNLALSQQQNIGLAIFIDPQTNRTTMAIVNMGGADLSGPEAYQAWTYQDGIHLEKADGTLDTATAVSYEKDDIVFVLNNDPTEKLLSPLTGTPKKTVKLYQCSQKHTADPIVTKPGVGSSWATYWQLILPSSADVEPNSFEQLPKGVGVEMMNETLNQSNADRYLHTGMIIFDPSGKVTAIPMTIARGNVLGTLLHLTADQPAPPFTVYSQIGLAIYDLGGVADQSFYANGADLEIAVPGRTTTPQNKQLEDNWISNNAQIYFINRFTGALEKAE